MRTFRWVAVGLVVVGFVGSGAARGGRYEGFTKKAAGGPRMRVAAATYFGGPGIEEFVAAGEMPDGGIVAFGNAWGPKFPARPRPTLLGKGRHRGLPPYSTGKTGPKNLRTDDPDMAGMIVFYGTRLRKVLKVVRFDWGVASISTGLVAADGEGLILAGRCTEAFRNLAKGAGSFKVHPASRREGAGGYAYEGVRCTGDVYVLRMSPETNRIAWVWVLEDRQTPPAGLWQDKAGAVYFQVEGVTRISVDGRTLVKLTDRGSGGRVGLRAVDPKDGNFFIGGDRNTSTGREPWRQPYFYRYDAKGNRVWKIWEWPSRGLRDGKGTDDGLVSDSAARAADVAPDGDIIVGGWSDGGNSVFTRQPTDLERPVPKSAYGMSAWGMKSANSLSYLMRIDPKTLDVKAWSLWVAYIPDTFESAGHRGAPNFTSITAVKFLANGSVAFTGSAATGLIQTPNAFYRYPNDGRRYGGGYVSVLTANLAHLLFSSYVPGCENLALGPARNGLIVASRSSGSDGGENPTPSPTVRALQRSKEGDYDGHLILLEMP